MAKLRKGDTVVVIAGKDKGKQRHNFGGESRPCKVEGINIVTKHQKPNQMLGKEGGIVKQEAFYIFQMLRFITQTPKKQIVLLIK